MTEFSELEQEMLRNMVQLHKSQNLCINSWISSLFNDRILLKFETLDNNPSVHKMIIKYDGIKEAELLKKIKYFHFLFERLESGGIIKVDHLGKVDFTFMVIDLGQEYSIADFPYRNLFNFFSWFGNNPILVSHFIVELIENEFRTPEQKRFEVQLKKAEIQIRIAWAAFSVSFVALIASSVLGMFQMYSETKLDKDQLNQIKQTIQQNTVPDVIKTEITNDTLTTRVVEKPQTRSKKQIK